MRDELVAALPRTLGRPRRTLVAGRFSLRHGEATAGDVLAERQVSAALTAAGVRHDTAWSPRFRPGALSPDAVRPEEYDALLFVCGPVHGPRVAALHARFGSCRRLAVGVILTHGQGEYGRRRRQEEVSARITDWPAGKDCVRVPVDTRLATDDWRLCATGEQFLSLVSRLDLVVTTRLHGLVLSLRTGTPVIAVDPVAGGAGRRRGSIRSPVRAVARDAAARQEQRPANPARHRTDRSGFRFLRAGSSPRPCSGGGPPGTAGGRPGRG
ncbi:polysaccharide pyruvyl transferase family protein [Streptomyces misionensis]|uniref:polysaccharide pyruvyl transferase family protein n=1 Tax=Streptomyces misionensis TaxID=67331 RepID=UPI00382BA64F